MPVINRIADYADEMKGWRHHLHQNPETEFDCKETAAFVAARLRDFGVDELHEGIAQTGLVAIIKGNGDGPVIGLRADMDALPIQEVRDLPHKSKVEGKMHACGHDGHTTMLLGAARYLAETRNFNGSVALIFQPAEEGAGGGEVMCQEGIMDRFNISQVYALHNWPNMPVGSFSVRPGPIMAAADRFNITVTGLGGHGAQPHTTVDPVVVASAIVQALQTVVSRNADPMENVVLSVTMIHSGDAFNVIPEIAEVGGTVRTFKADVLEKVVSQMERIVKHTAQAYGASAKFEYDYGYPPTVNHAGEASFAADVAETMMGADLVNRNVTPSMGGEDFAYMLQERPGAYLFLGQGESAGLHHPEYDFNDEVAPIGASFFAKLVETAQPKTG